MVFGIFQGPFWDASQIPNLSGRVAIVTGSNTGIGFVTALELARHGAKTYLACRSLPRAQQAIERIKHAVPGAMVEILPLNIAHLQSAHDAAQEFLRREDRLDILVNNAGICHTPYQLSPDGIELQACNGTGHFAFTIPLLPIMIKTASDHSCVRIVNVSSLGHKLVWRPDFSSLGGLNQESMCAVTRYGQSKLSNILFTNELQKKLKDHNICCLSVHPGTVATDLPRGLIQTWPILAHIEFVKHWCLMTPEKGALTQLYAATSPEVESEEFKGAYLVPFGKRGSKSSLAEDPEGTLGSQFWNLCEALVKEKVVMRS